MFKSATCGSVLSQELARPAAEGCCGNTIEKSQMFGGRPLLPKPMRSVGQHDRRNARSFDFFSQKSSPEHRPAFSSNVILSIKLHTSLAISVPPCVMLLVLLKRYTRWNAWIHSRRKESAYSSNNPSRKSQSFLLTKGSL